MADSISQRSTTDTLELSESMLVSDADLKTLAATLSAANPPAPPYVPREMVIRSVRNGGFGLWIGAELVGVAETGGRLQVLMGDWARSA
jgi:hypothetical protein